MYNFKQNVSYAGLCDVRGGKMWHCIHSLSDHESVYFDYKRDVIKYIRNNFEGEDRKFLLGQIKRYDGYRAGMYY